MYSRAIKITVHRRGGECRYVVNEPLSGERPRTYRSLDNAIARVRARAEYTPKR